MSQATACQPSERREVNSYRQSNSLDLAQTVSRGVATDVNRGEGGCGSGGACTIARSSLLCLVDSIHVSGVRFATRN